MKKKILIVLTIFISLFVLTGCGGGLEEIDTTLAGTYKSTKIIRANGNTEEEKTITLTIKDDKTAIMKTKENVEVHIKYDDTKMYIVEAEGEYYEYSKDNRELTLTSAGDKLVLIKE